MDGVVPTVREQGVRVRVVQALAGGQLLQGAVPVAVVVRAPDLPQVRGLVQRRGRLVLLVAPRRERGELVEVEGARHHDVLARQRVGEHRVGRVAVAQPVRAVLLRDPRGRAAALGGEAREDAGDGAARGLRRGLEVLVHLGGGAVERGVGGGGGELLAVPEGLELRLAGGPGAVAHDVGPLPQPPPDVVLEAAADPGGGGAVDVVGDGAAVVGHHAVDVGGAGGRGQEGPPDDEVEVAAGAQVVDLGRVPLDVDGLSGLERLEGALADVGALDGQTEAVERNLVGWFRSASVHNGS